MLKTFDGINYLTAANWFDVLDSMEYSSRPIKYLEVGTLHGANLLSVAETYGAHEASELHCIDPWMDYAEYFEYQGRQESHYKIFLKNLSNSEHANRITVHRGFSSKVILTFPDEYFDLIYIDGNHEPEFVLEDAVLAFRKLKRGGCVIFDDYGCGDPESVKRAVDAFIYGYHKVIEQAVYKNLQMFVFKKH